MDALSWIVFQDQHWCIHDLLYAVCYLSCPVREVAYCRRNILYVLFARDVSFFDILISHHYPILCRCSLECMSYTCSLLILVNCQLTWVILTQTAYTCSHYELIVYSENEIVYQYFSIGYVHVSHQFHITYNPLYYFGLYYHWHIQ